MSKLRKERIAYEVFRLRHQLEEHNNKHKEEETLRHRAKNNLLIASETDGMVYTYAEALSEILEDCFGDE
jgi:hypothetical protein